MLCSSQVWTHNMKSSALFEHHISSGAQVCSGQNLTTVNANPQQLKINLKFLKTNSSKALTTNKKGSDTGSITSLSRIHMRNLGSEHWFRWTTNPTNIHGAGNGNKRPGLPLLLPNEIPPSDLFKRLKSRQEEAPSSIHHSQVRPIESRSRHLATRFVWNDHFTRSQKTRENEESRSFHKPSNSFTALFQIWKTGILTSFLRMRGATWQLSGLCETRCKFENYGIDVVVNKPAKHIF